MRYSYSVEEKGTVRKVKRTNVADSNAIAGLLLGVLCCWFFSVIGSAGPNLGFYYTEPYYFSSAGRYTFNPSGPGSILLALACLWLLYIIFKRGLFGGLIFAIVIVLLGGIFLPSPGFSVTNKAREAETKQNLHSIRKELDSQFSKSGIYPLDIYSIITPEKGEEYDGVGIHWMPRNTFSRFKREKDYFETVRDKAFVGDTRPFSGTATSRFGVERIGMGNISTGYDVGRELVSWWDAFSEGDKPKKEQALLRGILAGNFIYLPCDDAGKPIPFSKAKTTPVKHYRLIAFGSPTNFGMDVWTPTGDPDMPIKLERDGKPDGVILVLQDEDG